MAETSDHCRQCGCKMRRPCQVLQPWQVPCCQHNFLIIFQVFAKCNSINNCHITLNLSLRLLICWSEQYYASIYMCEKMMLAAIDLKVLWKPWHHLQFLHMRTSSDTNITGQILKGKRNMLCKHNMQSKVCEFFIDH